MHQITFINIIIILENYPALFPKSWRERESARECERVRESEKAAERVCEKVK